MTKEKARPSEVLRDQANPEEYREVDLTGAPLLRPPATLRPREKTPLMLLGKQIETMTFGDDTRIDVQMDVIADIDEALEKVAIDPATYVAWVRKPGVDEGHIVALFARYVNDLGDSQRSAN